MSFGYKTKKSSQQQKRRYRSRTYVFFYKIFVRYPYIPHSKHSLSKRLLIVLRIRENYFFIF